MMIRIGRHLEEKLLAIALGRRAALLSSLDFVVNDHGAEINTLLTTPVNGRMIGLVHHRLEVVLR